MAELLVIYVIYIVVIAISIQGHDICTYVIAHIPLIHDSSIILSVFAWLVIPHYEHL